MNSCFRIILCLTALVFSGCASVRILNHPITPQVGTPALVVYAENPAELVQTGKDDGGKPVYGSFENWLHGAFTSSCDKLHYDYFEPAIVLKFAKTHGVLPVECSPITKDGQTAQQPNLHTFADSDLPGLFAASQDLGASYLVKAKLVKYERKDYYRSDKVKGDFTRVDVTVEITVHPVSDQVALFDKNFSVSEDNSSLFGELYGGGNVKKALAVEVLKEIRERSTRPTP
jgi:hypothetical protein